MGRCPSIEPPAFVHRFIGTQQPTWPESRLLSLPTRPFLALVSRSSLEIRDLDETVEKEVAAALAGALGRPNLDGHCRLHTRFGGVRTTVGRLADADASRLLQLGKVRVGW